MNTKKTSGQSRPTLIGGKPLVDPIDHGEDMLTPAETDDFEIEKHDSLKGVAEERVFEEESLYSPDSLTDYDMLLEAEDKKSTAMEKDSWFADNIFAAENDSVTDNNSDEEGEELAFIDLPVEPTYYDLTKEDEVDLDMEESEQPQSDSQLFNGLDDDFKVLQDDERLAGGELDTELIAVDSFEKYPHKEESDDSSLLSDGQFYEFESDDSDAGDPKVENFEGFPGDDSDEQSMRDYELEVDLLESAQTTEDEAKENLEAAEQERPDDDSMLFIEQLPGFEDDDAGVEDPVLNNVVTLPGDDGPVSDELDDALDDFFTRYDNTGPDLEKFADLRDNVGSGESGFIAEPTNDILESNLTTEDETTGDHEETEREYAVFSDLLEPAQTTEDETKENLEATEQERPDDNNMSYTEQFHGFESDDAGVEDPDLDSLVALSDDDGPVSDELDDFFTRDDRTSSDLDTLADLLDDNSFGESGFNDETTNDILDPNLTTEDETTEDYEETATEYAVFSDLLEPSQATEDETKENLEATEQERPDDNNMSYTEQLHGFESDDAGVKDPALDSLVALSDDDGPVSDELDDFFTRDDRTSSDLDSLADLLDDNSSGESGFTAEPTNDILDPNLTTEDETTEDHEETEREYVVFSDLLEPAQTAEDETKENLEAAEQERPDDDSMLYVEQLQGFDGDVAGVEDPALDSLVALSDDDGPVSDELDDFFTRDDRKSSDLDSLADLLDDNSSGESGFTAEPTNDILDPNLTTEDETTEDHDETETEDTVFIESAVDQTVIITNTNEEVVPYEGTEQIATGQLPKKKMPERGGLFHVAADAKQGASIIQNIRKLVARSRHCLVKSGKRLVIVMAVLFVLGGGWYGYHYMEDGNYTLQQQESRNNLGDNSEVEVIGLNQPDQKMPESSNSGKKDPVDASKQKVREQLEANTGERINLLQDTRQLDRTLSAEEQELRRNSNGDQRAQVGSQLKPQREMQSIETDQPGDKEKIALQAGQIETDIGQFEDRVSPLRQEQNIVRNTISSTEQKTVAGTSAPATIEVETGLEQKQKKEPAIAGESFTSKVVSGPAEQRTSATPPPNFTEVNETIFYRPDKPIQPEAGTAKQTSWTVNLSSFRKLSSAEKEQERLIGLGLETVIRKAQVRGTLWFRVQIEGFSSSRDAWDYIKLQLDHKKFKDAWVSKKTQ